MSTPDLPAGHSPAKAGAAKKARQAARADLARIVDVIGFSP
jgi:hypothetical protein